MSTNPECAPAERVMQLAGGYVISSALNAAIRLNIAETLAEEEMSIASLARKVNVEEDALFRVMRMLTSLKVFAQVRPRVFSNNEVSNTLRSDAPNSQRPSVEFITDPFHFKIFADMVPTIQTGRTAVELVTGGKAFEALENDVDEQRRFNDAMTNMAGRAAPAILEAYDFSGIETLVDVAGGHGVLLTSILQKHQQLKGVLFDLPHVIEGAANRIAELNLTRRCSTVAGDFFQSVPSADAYIMRHIIHDWDDEHALLILKNCHQAMAKTGARKLLVVEMILPTANEPHPSLFLDIEMLMFPGGRERTEQEYAALLERAGFRLTRVIPTRSPNCLIEAVPATV